MGKIEYIKSLMCPKSNHLIGEGDCCNCRHYKGMDYDHDAVECDLAID